MEAWKSSRETCSSGIPALSHSTAAVSRNWRGWSAGTLALSKTARGPCANLDRGFPLAGAAVPEYLQKGRLWFYRFKRGDRFLGKFWERSLVASFPVARTESTGPEIWFVL